MASRVAWLLDEFESIGLTRADAEKVAMMRDSKDGDAREKYDARGGPGGMPGGMPGMGWDGIKEDVWF